MKYLKQNPDVLKSNIESFEEEIGYLGGHPILIGMGDKAYGILRDSLGEKYEIKKVYPRDKKDDKTACRRGGNVLPAVVA